MRTRMLCRRLPRLVCSREEFQRCRLDSVKAGAFRCTFRSDQARLPSFQIRAPLLDSALVVPRALTSLVCPPALISSAFQSPVVCCACLDATGFVILASISRLPFTFACNVRQGNDREESITLTRAPERTATSSTIRDIRNMTNRAHRS